MTTTKLLSTFLVLAFTSSVALADDPPTIPPAEDAPKPPDAIPPPDPKPQEEDPKPDAAKPDPAKPDPAKPDPAKPDPAKGINIPSTTTPTTSDGASGPKAFDDLGGGGSVSRGTSVSKDSHKPKLAAELSFASGQLVDPFIQYKGWSLENGLSKGMRLEGNLGGIMAAYELSSMGNDEMCIANGDCLTGNFGSTTMHSAEIGYRYRMNKILVLRPFISASLGGVIGSAGDWGMSSGSFKGGLARAVAGVELPIAGKVFGSASIGYRFMVVQNPYHTKELELLQAAFVNAGKVPVGDRVEDLHSIAFYLGVGVSL